MTIHRRFAINCALLFIAARFSGELYKRTVEEQ